VRGAAPSDKGVDAADDVLCLQDSPSASPCVWALSEKLAQRPGCVIARAPTPPPARSCNVCKLASNGSVGGRVRRRLLPVSKWKPRVFHRINLDSPGLQLVHTEPYTLVYIFIVSEFLSERECEKLIALQASSEEAGPSATSEEQSAVRTS